MTPPVTRDEVLALAETLYDITGKPGLDPSVPFAAGQAIGLMQRLLREREALEKQAKAYRSHLEVLVVRLEECLVALKMRLPVAVAQPSDPGQPRSNENRGTDGRPG